VNQKFIHAFVVSTTRPRVRSNEGGEFPLETLQWFQREDSLNQAVLTRLLSRVICRKYEQTLDLPQKKASCTSKSEISRRFIAGMQTAMDKFFSRRLEEYPAIMIVISLKPRAKREGIKRIAIDIRYYIKI
jgi:hypothetical protein